MMATLTSISNILRYAVSNSFKRIAPLSLNNSCHSVLRSWKCGTVSYHTRLPWIPSTPDYQVEVPVFDKQKEKIVTDVTEAINKQIATNTTGRLFAVVHLCGKQFKITENDIIIIQGSWPPSIGDQLKLEKVLLVGASDFTLIGRPILNRELVSVDTTVIEKTLSHTKYHFKMRKRKQYRKLRFYRIQHTTLRINSIKINGNIDEKKEVEGLDRVY